VPSPSTAAGAQAVADGQADAAVAAPIAAERYRLAVLAGDIGDTAGAVTRFVVLAPPGPPPEPTGADRTTIVAYEAEDHPGALLAILTEYAVRGVNLTRIESRPTGGGLGRYCFSIDASGHVADERVGEALAALRRVCADVRFLGSYPRADGVAAQVRRGMSDPEFRDATTWVNRLRAGR
jgi:prephenate dehydratase